MVYGADGVAANSLPYGHLSPLPTIGNSLKKQKSLYKVLSPSIKTAI